MELSDAFTTTHHDDVGLATADHIGTLYDRVGSRRTSRSQRGGKSEFAEMASRHLRAAATVVNGNVFLVRVTIEVIEIVLLAHVHTAYRSA